MVQRNKIIISHVALVVLCNSLLSFIPLVIWCVDGEVKDIVMMVFCYMGLVEVVQLPSQGNLPDMIADSIYLFALFLI